MNASTRRSPAGFTLVELLVVIGIIALLISILLPSLNKARKSAMAVKCLANERSIGQAFMMYAVDFRGAIVPCEVWNVGAGDAWPFFLVQGHYLPDPHITGGSVGPAASNSVLVCPAIRDVPIYDATSPPYPFNLTGGTNDGYERRTSVVLLKGVETADNNSHTAGPPYPCVLDIGYGVNGTNNLDTAPTVAKYLPMLDVVQVAGGGHTISGASNMAQFRRAAQTVLLFDGTESNVFSCNPLAAPGKYLWRVAGSRHGNWQGPVGAPKSFSTGICNVLFLDGHAAAVDRSALPVMAGSVTTAYGSTNAAQMLGPLSQLVDKAASPGMSNAYVWNRSQE